MNFYGYTPHPEVAYNAMPIAPRWAEAIGIPAGEAPRFSNGPAQDSFTRRHAPHLQMVSEAPSKTPPSLTEFSSDALQAALSEKLAMADADSLHQVSSWLNAAHKMQKIVFGIKESASQNFGRHLRQGIEALTGNDLPAAKLFFQRARREITGFQNLTADTKPSNPFVLN